MQTRSSFFLGIGSFCTLASCSGGITSEVPSVTVSHEGERHIARWVNVSARNGDWHIDVSGYSFADIINGQVPLFFDFDSHPELPKLPPEERARTPHLITTKPTKPCASELCISPQWYRDQGGSTAIYHNSSGTYFLPNGSTWVSTDVRYSGPNNTGVLEGYSYHGSDGSDWFAGSNHANFPETQLQFQMNQDAWYNDNTSPC